VGASAADTALGTCVVLGLVCVLCSCPGLTLLLFFLVIIQKKQKKAKKNKKKKF
jgi:hypothetical protein